MTARHIRAAVEENGIGRVVFQSSGGAEKRHGVGEIDGLAAGEVALDATGAAVFGSNSPGSACLRTTSRRS